MNGFEVDPQVLAAFSTRLRDTVDGLDNALGRVPSVPDTGKAGTNKKLAHIFESLIAQVGELSTETERIANGVTDSAACYGEVEEEQRRRFTSGGGTGW
jgi:hypothetical protein